MDFDGLRGHIRGIERVLDEFVGGHENKDAWIAIQHFSVAIRCKCDRNPDLVEKLISLEVFAEILYGGLRNARYRGPGVIKLIMLNQLASL